MSYTDADFERDISWLRFDTKTTKSSGVALERIIADRNALKAEVDRAVQHAAYLKRKLVEAEAELAALRDEAERLNESLPACYSSSCPRHPDHELKHLRDEVERLHELEFNDCENCEHRILIPASECQVLVINKEHVRRMKAAEKVCEAAKACQFIAAGNGLYAGGTAEVTALVDALAEWEETR